MNYLLSALTTSQCSLLPQTKICAMNHTIPFFIDVVLDRITMNKINFDCKPILKSSLVTINLADKTVGQIPN